MLNKVFGSMAGLGLTGSLGFLGIAFQGAQSSAGKRGLLVAAGLCFAVGIVGVIGWLLTHNVAPEPERASARTDGHSMASAGNARSEKQSGGVTVGSVGKQTIVYGSQEETKPKASGNRFVSNRDQTLGVLGRAGITDAESFIWWQLAGWRFYPGSDRPKLVLEAHCNEHKTRFLAYSKNADAYELATCDELSGQGEGRNLQCSGHADIHYLWEPWSTTCARGLALAEAAASIEGWRYPPPKEAGVFFA
jgi:hypothetical protein